MGCLFKLEKAVLHSLHHSVQHAVEVGVVHLLEMVGTFGMEMKHHVAVTLYDRGMVAMEAGELVNFGGILLL